MATNIINPRYIIGTTFFSKKEEGPTETLISGKLIIDMTSNVQYTLLKEIVVKREDYFNNQFDSTVHQHVRSMEGLLKNELKTCILEYNKLKL